MSDSSFRRKRCRFFRLSDFLIAAHARERGSALRVQPAYKQNASAPDQELLRLTYRKRSAHPIGPSVGGTIGPPLQYPDQSHSSLFLLADCTPGNPTRRFRRHLSQRAAGRRHDRGGKQRMADVARECGIPAQISSLCHARKMSKLPLLHPMEERAGERRCLGRVNLRSPLSSVLSPLLRRGERKKTALENLRGPRRFRQITLFGGFFRKCIAA